MPIIICTCFPITIIPETIKYQYNIRNNKILKKYSLLSTYKYRYFTRCLLLFWLTSTHPVLITTWKFVFIFTKNNYNYSKLCNNLWIIGLKYHFTDIPRKKIVKFENCKKIYKINIYVNCYAQNSVRNDIRCMMGYGFDSWFLWKCEDVNLLLLFYCFADVYHKYH